MNRIILIGNGFDLAHKMKTGYKDFLNSFWNDKFQIIKKSPNDSSYFHYIDEDIQVCDQRNIKSDYSFKRSRNLTTLIQENCAKPDYVIAEYFNDFLGIITHKNETQNWVDIENIYYQLLKYTYKDEHSRSSWHKQIDKLNSEFETIKLYLKEYLIKVERDFSENFKDEDLVNYIKCKIYADFDVKDFEERFLSDTFSLPRTEFIGPKRDYITGQGQINITGGNIEFKKYHNPNPDNILFLNFNYTQTEKIYIDDNIPINQEIIHIHGSLEEEENPMIFGYGDELDEDHKTIENLNDDRYLDNIKSIDYLKTNNYKRLLRFINRDPFQVYIFGHSCGNSDRTLLNTLFEHKNCCSIKPFYREYNNDKDILIDNHNSMVKSIYRNFNDKASMRDKVVNKSDCEPLVPVRLQEKQNYSFTSKTKPELKYD